MRNYVTVEFYHMGNMLLCQAVAAMQLGGSCVTDAVFAHGGWVPVLRVKLANAQLRGRSRFIS